MYDPLKHVIHSINGQLKEAKPKADTTRQHIKEMVAAALAEQDPVLVVHFHGGLVDKKAGSAIAERLWKVYSGTPRYPIFFVWEAGLIESIRNNLEDIRNDKLFQQLIKKVSRWVLKLLPAGVGLKGSGGNVDPVTLEKEFDAWFAGNREEVPTAFQATMPGQVTLRGANPPDDEIALANDIQDTLKGDIEFIPLLGGLHKSLSPADLEKPTPKSSGVGSTVSPETEIAPQQVKDLFDITPNTKGNFTLATIAIFIAKVVRAVVGRYRADRDHGAYTTIVEEVLAAAYIDKIGGVVWRQMKKDTADAFATDAPGNLGAGAALLKEIHDQQKAAGKTFERIVLIGHSTGAVYIGNLLDASESLLPDMKFDIVLLAPAITYQKLAETLVKHAPRVANVRRFAMQDSVECQDELVPHLYKRSLLYFVSGMVEFTDGASPVRVPDTPLVGMQRFVDQPQFKDAAKFPHVATVEAFMSGFANGSIWSVTAADAVLGLQSSSRKHGDFDNDTTTLASIVRILNSGY